MPKPLHRQRTNTVFRSSDRAFDEAISDRAFINGVCIFGDYVKQVSKVLVGGRGTGKEVCVHYFEFYAADCLELTCGDCIKVDAQWFTVTEIGKPNQDGEVKAYLRNCTKCEIEEQLKKEMGT